MLSNDGTTPAPVFKDLVENTDYAGTILIGVSPDLFFDRVDWEGPFSRPLLYFLLLAILAGDGPASGTLSAAGVDPKEFLPQ